MAFGFQPAGLFGRRRKPMTGLPGPISGFGGGTFNTDGTQATPVDRYPDEPMGAPQEAMQAAPKPGLFGKIAGAAGNIGAILDDEPSPQEIERDRQRFAEQQYRSRALAEQQQAAVQREADWQDYLRKQEYEASHPKAANNDTLNDMAAAATWTPEQWAIYDKLHPVYKTGPDGLPYPVARSSLGGAPTAPVGKLTPITGGPQGKPAGTFPPGY